jgi:hypothetical protein
MRTLLSTRVFFSFLFLSLFSSAKDLPFLIEVKKDTPLFLRPSIGSEKLVEAEAGTMLLFVEKSKKGIWVKLSDADGTSGWMPTDRTDYQEVKQAQVSMEQIQSISQREVPEAKQKTKEEMMEEALRAREAQEQNSFNPNLRIAPLMKWLSDSEPTSTRIGLRVDYNLGSTSLGPQQILGPAWAAVEASFPAPQVKGESDFSAALRYVWKAPLWGPLVYGPDIGYSIDKVRSEYRHHMSLGLATALVLGPVDLMLRGSYDLFSQSRLGVEVQLGVSF